MKPLIRGKLNFLSYLEMRKFLKANGNTRSSSFFTVWKERRCKCQFCQIRALNIRQFESLRWYPANTYRMKQSVTRHKSVVQTVYHDGDSTRYNTNTRQWSNALISWTRLVSTVRPVAVFEKSPTDGPPNACKHHNGGHTGYLDANLRHTALNRNQSQQVVYVSNKTLVTSILSSKTNVINLPDFCSSLTSVKAHLVRARRRSTPRRTELEFTGRNVLDSRRVQITKYCNVYAIHNDESSSFNFTTRQTQPYFETHLRSSKHNQRHITSSECIQC